MDAWWAAVANALELDETCLLVSGHEHTSVRADEEPFVLIPLAGCYIPGNKRIETNATICQLEKLCVFSVFSMDGRVLIPMPVCSATPPLQHSGVLRRRVAPRKGGATIWQNRTKSNLTSARTDECSYL